MKRLQSYTVEQSVDVPDPRIQKETVENRMVPITRIRDEIAEKKDEYEKFYEQFVKCMKLGIHENSVDDFEIAELLRSNTSKLEDEKMNWKEYVDRMKERLNDIYKTRKKHNNIKLYTRRAFTMDDCDELISEWLNFVKCVVDSGDIPMNISRETLRQNKILSVAKKKLVKKCLEIFAEYVDRKDDCEKFYEQCDSCLKLETREGSTIRAKIAGLLRLNASMSGGEQVSLKECASCKTEEKNDVYHFTDESIDMMFSSSFLDNLRKKGHEVLYMVDPVSESAVQQLQEFDGKKLKSTMKEELDPGDENETKKAGGDENRVQTIDKVDEGDSRRQG